MVKYNLFVTRQYKVLKLQFVNNYYEFWRWLKWTDMDDGTDLLSVVKPKY